MTSIYYIVHKKVPYELSKVSWENTGFKYAFTYYVKHSIKSFTLYFESVEQGNSLIKPKDYVLINYPEYFI